MGLGVALCDVSFFFLFFLVEGKRDEREMEKEREIWKRRKGTRENKRNNRDTSEETKKEKGKGGKRD